MNREQEYRQLANSVFQRASEEDSVLLKAQWEILGARYSELADQSKKISENDTVYDPIPWDRLRDTPLAMFYVGYYKTLNFFWINGTLRCKANNFLSYDFN